MVLKINKYSKKLKIKDTPEGLKNTSNEQTLINELTKLISKDKESNIKPIRTICLNAFSKKKLI
jgi:hypothetical protein